jgi:EAL domain-containing protein (putative c-di-GMP-specific phosphodiesterase class I)
VRLSIDGLDMVSSGTDTLVDLPVEELKLGPAAVRHHGRHGCRPVAGVDELAWAARSRGMRIVGAGVDTEAHARVLAGLGVVAAQGRWFAPPQSAEASTRLLAADVRFRRDAVVHPTHARPHGFHRQHA